MLRLTGPSSYSEPQRSAAACCNWMVQPARPVPRSRTVARSRALARSSDSAYSKWWESGSGDGGLGTLTLNGTLNLAGNAVFELNKTGSALSCDRVTGITTLTYGGVLIVTSSGHGALSAGDSSHSLTPAAMQVRLPPSLSPPSAQVSPGTIRI